MSKHSNYTTIRTACPECKTQPVIRDNVRLETYCPQCGLILQDQTIPSIIDEIRQNKENIRLKRMQEIWRTIKFTKEKKGRKQ